MSTIPTVEPNVSLIEGVGNRFTNNATPDSFGAGVGKELQDLGTVANAFAIQTQTKINQIAVMKAQTELMKGLQENQLEQLNKQGENALGRPATDTQTPIPSAIEAFGEYSQKAFDETMGTLTNNLQKQKLQEWYQANQPGMLLKVMEHQGKQLDAVHLQTWKDNIAANTDSFAGFAVNGDFLSADQSIRNVEEASKTMGAWRGLSADSQKQQDQSFVNEMVDKAVDQLIKANRSQEAYQLVERYKNHLSPDAIEVQRQKISPAITQDKVSYFVHSLYNNPEYRNPDGTFNVVKARQAVDEQSKRTRQIRAGFGSSDPRINEIYQAAVYAGEQLNVPPEVIMAQWAWESSHYQSQLALENNNLSGLTQTEPNGEDNKQPDGSNDYMQFGSIQEFAKAYVNFIKTNDASAVGKQDVASYVTELKNNGYFTDDLGKYINGVQSIYDSQASEYGQTTTVTDVDTSFQQAGYALIDQLSRDSQLDHQQRIKNAQDAIASYMASNPNASYSEVTAKAGEIASKYRLTASEADGIKQTGYKYIGQQKAITRQQQAEQFEAVSMALYRGQIRTEQEIENMAPGLTAQQYMSLKSAFIDPKYKWASTANMDMVTGVLTANGVNDGITRANVINVINAANKESVDSGHGPLTTSEIQGIAQQSVTKIRIGEYESGDGYDAATIDIPKVNLPPGSGIGKDGGVYDANGHPVGYDLHSESSYSY